MAVHAVVLFVKQATKVLLQTAVLFEVLILQIFGGWFFFLYTEYTCKQVMAIYRVSPKNVYAL